MPFHEKCSFSPPQSTLYKSVSFRFYIILSFLSVHQNIKKLPMRAKITKKELAQILPRMFQVGLTKILLNR